MSDSSKQIKYGSLISYVLIFLNIALGLVYTPLIIKEVGSSNYGLYTLSSSLIALFLVDFGMSVAVTRFIANYRAEGNQEKINSFAGLAVKIYLILCVVLAAIFFVVFLNVKTIYGNLTPEEIESFKVIFIISAVFVVACFPVYVCNGILNAYEEYVALKGSDIFNKLGTVIVTIIALLLHGGVYALVFINGFFNLVTFIVKIVLIKRRTPVKLKFTSTEKGEAKDLIAFSGWITVQQLSHQMTFNLLPSVLAMVANTFAIALYGFANTIHGYVYTITEAINGLFVPRISRTLIQGKGSMEDNAPMILPLMIKVGRINQSIVTLLLIGIGILGKEFVNLWVGAEYSDLYFCIMPMILPYFISASQQIANSTMNVLNKAQYTALINLFTGLINLVAAYFVARKFGVVGACTVLGIVFVIRIMLSTIAYKNVLRINIWSFFKNCHIKMLPGIVLSAVASYFIVKIFPSNVLGLRGWIWLAVKALLITGIYFAIMWITAWNDFEKGLIRSFKLKRR